MLMATLSKTTKLFSDILKYSAANKIISKSNYGYMIVNNFNNLSFRYLSKKGYSKTIKNMSIHEEIPESYIFNKLLTFRS